jgi:SAM-dependent methyltransferase
MRIGIVGERVLERILATTDLLPAPLLETQIAFTMARSIMAGVKLGVFDAIGAGATTPAEVATACRIDPAATAKLMDTLVGCRYRRHRAGHYTLAPKSRTWLLRDSPNSIADKMLMHYDEWDTVAKYEEDIASGQPLDLHATLTDPASWQRYQRGMRAMAALSADEVAARLPVPAGATAMLDIGGSHGFYSVCLCRRHAALRATILDLPAAVEQAAPILAREHMGDRVRHRAGSAPADDLGENAWDVVFMSQLMHHFTDEQNRAVMGRIARGLKPGGVCVVIDMLRPASPEKAGGMAAVLDLYFAATSRSGTWPLATMQSWQRDAGLRVEKPIHLRTLPGGAMVIGRKAVG